MFRTHAVCLFRRMFISASRFGSPGCDFVCFFDKCCMVRIYGCGFSLIFISASCFGSLGFVFREALHVSELRGVLARLFS